MAHVIFVSHQTHKDYGARMFSLGLGEATKCRNGAFGAG